MKSPRTIPALVVSMALSLLACTLQANEPKWTTSRYSHFSENEGIVQVLRSFAASQQIPVVISEKVEGVLNGRFTDLKPKEFLDRLSSTYNLTWYYDGHALYIYRGDEIQNRMLFLSHLSVDELYESLRRLEVIDTRFGWKSIPERGLVHVSGPPRFVELVDESTRMLDQEFGKREAKVYELRLFPLTYAWAEDRRVVSRDREITVPGLATILRNILSDENQGGHPLRQDQGVSRTVRKLKGTGLNAPTPAPASSTPTGSGSASGGDGGLLDPTDINAVVEADGRLNAVVVRDTRARMPFYAELIKALDVPRQQVEIEAMILDVATNSLKDFGFAWQYYNEDVGAIGFGSIPNKPDPAYDTISAVIGEGASFSTLVGVNHFLARVRALEGEGNARILAKPSVLTLDNLEAELTKSSTFYVRVAGTEEVDLFPVTTGTVLKVTPHVIDYQSNQRVLLDVHIEDGQSTQETVDGIPVVENSTIVTQAVVPERRSLLIGGYRKATNAALGDKVPLLGDIPGLGMMFRHSSDEQKEMARLFLITPRVISPEQLPAEDSVRTSTERMFRGDAPVTMNSAIQTSAAAPIPVSTPESAPPSPSPPPTSSDGAGARWIEIGDFGQRANAERLRDRLIAERIEARVVEAQDQLGFIRSTVQVGNFESCAHIDQGGREIRRLMESEEIGGRYRCRGAPGEP